MKIYMNIKEAQVLSFDMFNPDVRNFKKGENENV
jgi:hypothetical protein